MDIESEISQLTLESAQTHGLLDGDELLTVPEALTPLNQTACGITSELVDFHAYIGKQLQLPIFQQAYCYIFAKGVEAAYQWAESADGDISLNYDIEDLLKGRVGAQISTEFQSAINELIPVAQDSFLPIQDWLVANLGDVTSVEDGVVLCVQHTLERSGLVGLHCGLRQLGY